VRVSLGNVEFLNDFRVAYQVSYIGQRCTALQNLREVSSYRRAPLTDLLGLIIEPNVINKNLLHQLCVHMNQLICGLQLRNELPEEIRALKYGIR